MKQIVGSNVNVIFMQQTCGQRSREIMLSIGKPKGRSRIISNIGARACLEAKKRKESKREPALLPSGLTSTVSSSPGHDL